ncbi:hypothetical protein R4I72_09910 [Leclercia adecarboxylata]|uniref:hypothetical protein n=1 Tax=Leclercia adecarboxylata TaxID=83655 RepID=UPI0027BCB6D5|nr:hypothetical protein [Leclercia adecarboxylata]MDQ2128761.1 hypothetical protein [Leclercia adecarboxylata]MDV7057374.1 hypothetical protein [Leclercia adecarboxylata]
MMNYIQGDCGSSKTYSMIEMMKRTDIPYLLVHSELQLMNQSAAALGNICIVISSQNTSNVEHAVNQFLKQPSHRILVISERAFLQIQDLKLLKNWKIILDDVVNFHSFKPLNVTDLKKVVHTKLFTDFVDLDKQYCTAKPVRSFTDDLITSIYDDRFEFIDRYDSFRMNSNFFSTKIQNDQEVYNDDCNQLTVLAWVDIQKYVDAGLDMTFMANKFTESLLYRSNPGLFTEVKISLRQRAVPVKDRLKVFYFLDKTRFTSTFRTDNADALPAIAQYIEQNVTGQYYCTSNSSTKGDMTKILTGQYISPNSRGMNTYQGYHTAVWLASMKPSPVELVMCREQFGITGQDLVQAREYENLYQFINRSNLRDYDSQSEIVVYVADREQAESLGTANIHHIDLGLEDDSTEKLKPGRPEVFSADDKKLRKAFSTLQSRHKGDVSTELFDKWCTKKKLTEQQIEMLRGMMK